MKEKDNGSGQSMKETAANIPTTASDLIPVPTPKRPEDLSVEEVAEAADLALAEALIHDGGAGLVEFLDGLGISADSTAPRGPTAEEIQAQSDAREAARVYDVPANFERIKASQAAIKKQVETHLTEVFSFITAEYNAAVLNGDEKTQALLVTAEGPRWYQLGVQELQSAFMKLERAFNHQQGL